MSQREKSGVTGFLVGVLEMRWGAGWCGKGVDSARGTSRQEAGDAWTGTEMESSAHAGARSHMFR